MATPRPAPCAPLLAISLLASVLAPALAQMLLSNCVDDPTSSFLGGLAGCDSVNQFNLCAALPEVPVSCPQACDSLPPACTQPIPGGTEPVRLNTALSSDGNLLVFVATSMAVGGYQFDVGCQVGVANAPTWVESLGSPLLATNGFDAIVGDTTAVVVSISAGTFGPGFDLLQELAVELNDCPADQFCLDNAQFVDALGIEVEICGGCGNPCPVLAEGGVAPVPEPAPAPVLIEQLPSPPSPPSPHLETPAPTPASIISDPHMRGFLGQQLDITGKPGHFYALVSESAFAINARFAEAYTNGVSLGPMSAAAMTPKGTWISDLALRTHGHSMLVNTEWSPLEPLCPEDPASHDKACFLGGTIIVDEDVVVRPGSFALSDDCTITITNFRSFGRVAFDNAMLSMSVDYVPPPLHWALERQDFPTYSHLNVHVNRVQLSENAHGLLGQTVVYRFDELGQPIMTSSGKDGEGVIQGTPADYELPSIMSTEFKYSRFKVEH